MSTDNIRLRGARRQARNRRILHHEPLCRMCKAAGRTVAAVEVDHVIPLFRGGADDESNLQALCVECHRLKTSAELSGKAAYGADGWPVTPAASPPYSPKDKGKDDDLDAPGRLTIA